MKTREQCQLAEKMATEHLSPTWDKSLKDLVI